MVSHLYKSFVVLLTAWAGVTTYLLHQEVGLGVALHRLNFLDFNNDPESIDVSSDIKFIEDVVTRYYNVDHATSVNEKMNFIKNRFSESLFFEIGPRIKNSTIYFLDNKGTQSADIYNISYDKESGGVYKIVMRVSQKISNGQTSNFDVNLSLKLKRGKTMVVADWQEETGVLKTKNSKSTIYLAIGKPLKVHFPCRMTNVLPVEKQSSIEYKVNSDSDSIIFELMKEIITSPAKFRVLCEKIKFDVEFTANREQFMVLNKLPLESGAPIQKKLSPQEKMNLSIKKQLIEMGLVE